MSTNNVRAKEIGKRIALARKEAAGMKQRELGELLDVTERSIAAYEKGDVVPYRFLPKLEEILGKPAAWFLYGDAALEPRESQAETLRNQQIIISLLHEVLEKLGAERT